MPIACWRLGRSPGTSHICCPSQGLAGGTFTQTSLSLPSLQPGCCAGHLCKDLLMSQDEEGQSLQFPWVPRVSQGRCGAGAGGSMWNSPDRTLQPIRMRRHEAAAASANQRHGPGAPTAPCSRGSGSVYRSQLIRGGRGDAQRISAPDWRPSQSLSRIEHPANRCF